MPEPRLRVLFAAVVLAAGLHLEAAPSHFPPTPVPLALAHGAHPGGQLGSPRSTLPAGEQRDLTLLGSLFVLAAGWGASCAWWLATRPVAPLGWVLLAGSHLLMIAAGIVSRTVGLLGHHDSWWEVAFLLALASEAVVVWLSVAELLPRRIPADTQPRVLLRAE
jgi:hypothetical protein